MSEKEAGDVRITVDPEICMGSTTCIAVASALFDISDGGTAVPIHEVVAPSEALTEAVSRCPTGAISVTPA